MLTRMKFASLRYHAGLFGR